MYSIDGSKYYEPEIFYILAGLFNWCLEESSFTDCWKVPSVVPVFKYVAENCHPVCLLSAVSKVFEKLVDNRTVVTCGLAPLVATWNC